MKGTLPLYIDKFISKYGIDMFLGNSYTWDILVDGQWGIWKEWSKCDGRCPQDINGVRTRNRLCDSPSPNYGGNYCIGESNKTESCNLNTSCGINRLSELA